MSLTSQPPKGLLRWALKAPMYLYRVGLGGLLGQRFIELEHIGRKSGKVYHTVVEVVGHDKAQDVYNIASGWGYTSQWYQNIMAHPDIAVKVGWRTLKVQAEQLSPQAGADVLLAYQKNHQAAARELGRVMGFDLAGADRDELAHVVEERLPILALHVQSEA